jgi:shikimate kinase
MFPHPPKSPGCLIILNGFPGVGKLTIARSLQSRFTDVETRLVDNHLIIDPAEAVHPGRGLQHKEFRERLRRVIFDELKTVPEQDTVLIMTCSLGANEADAAVFAEHLEASHLSNPLQQLYVEAYHSPRFRSPDTEASHATSSR